MTDHFNTPMPFVLKMLNITQGCGNLGRLRESCAGECGDFGRIGYNHI